MSYNNLFAEYYDRLTFNVDRQKMLDFICHHFKKQGLNNGIILDAGCGSGGLCLLLSNRGYELIGVDASADMLMSAREVVSQGESSVLLLCQQLHELDLYGTIDGAVCTLDTINHITNLKQLQQTFEKISLFTVSGGVFIFDVNTKYKHQTVLANNSFIYDLKDLYCGWQNEYDENSQITTINLSFFKQDNHVYYREDEQFFERYYSPEQLTDMLAAAKFKVIGVFDDYTQNPLNETSQRAVYVTVKE